MDNLNHWEPVAAEWVSDEIQLKVKEFGRWTLGYALVEVRIFGGTFPCLALYAEHKGESHRKIVSTVKEAIGFFADLKAPAKGTAQVLRHAEAEGWRTL